eukprot:4009-Heterococcus_DN1.PRE.2
MLDQLFDDAHMPPETAASMLLDCLWSQRRLTSAPLYHSRVTMSRKPSLAASLSAVPSMPAALMNAP